MSFSEGNTEHQCRLSGIKEAQPSAIKHRTSNHHAPPSEGAFEGCAAYADQRLTKTELDKAIFRFLTAVARFMHLATTLVWFAALAESSLFKLSSHHRPANHMLLPFDKKCFVPWSWAMYVACPSSAFAFRPT